ncbi:hypothetical protein NKH36_34045 [Mesorhizobium sp. M1312]|uniref:hypothetical protein n=1 Tax=unclassified Mesorhizobium TaxID=325217 RepID=UPI0033388FB2
MKSWTEDVMPRRRKQEKKPDEEHTYLAIRVERCEASVEASINYNVYAPQYAWNLDDDDPLHQLRAQLIVTGVATYPEERAGDAYELTIYGDNSRRLSETVKDRRVTNTARLGIVHIAAGRSRSTIHPQVWASWKKFAANHDGRPCFMFHHASLATHSPY